jgi:hypothetical protein
MSQGEDNAVFFITRALLTLCFFNRLKSQLALPCGILVTLCEAAHQTGPRLWAGAFILHHNNAPGHDKRNEQEF